MSFPDRAEIRIGRCEDCHARPGEVVTARLWVRDGTGGRTGLPARRLCAACLHGLTRGPGAVQVVAVDGTHLDMPAP